VTQSPSPRTVNVYEGFWTWNSGAVPPLAGQLRTNSGTWAGATALAFWDHDNTGTDATKLFQAIAANDTLHIQQANNSTNWSDYTVTGAATLAANVWTLPVTRSGGTGQASNGQNTTCTFNLDVATGAGPIRECTEHDLDGFVVHQTLVAIYHATGYLGADLGWCQYCHQVAVLREP
jgi:hypothetical protein